MAYKILILGLPGAGKTTLASKIVEKLGDDVLWLNADKIRQEYDDWDFSLEGRIRQSERMKTLADSSKTKYVIADFVCPLQRMRDIFSADYIIWVDTIEKSKYDDTNNLFEDVVQYDIRIAEKDSEQWSSIIAWNLVNGN